MSFTRFASPVLNVTKPVKKKKTTHGTVSYDMTDSLSHLQHFNLLGPACYLHKLLVQGK